MTQPLHPIPPRRPSPAPGWLLLIPAFVLWLFGLVLPVLSTLYMSVLEVRPIGPGGGEFVGAENYLRLLGDERYWDAAGFTLLTVVVRVVAFGVLPPLLAWGAVALGRWAAVPLSVVFAVPLTFATPVFASVATRVQAEPGALGSPNRARIALLDLGGTHALLYGCALGLVVLVAALRAETGPGRTGLLGRPFLVAWSVGLSAAAAYGLQAFTEVSIVTAGGPANATATLGFRSLTDALQTLRFGYAAAQEVVILVPVLLLGLGAGLLVVLGRVGVDLYLDAAAQDRRTPKAVAVVLGAVALLLALVAWGRGLSPIAAGWTGRPVRGIDLGAAAERLLVHDLPTTLFVVAVALAGAFGIVVFRPLGRWSERLLLPFAPWLFVTSVSVGPALFLAYTRGIVQRPFAHLQPALGLLPILLFAFVVLLRGLEPRWRAELARPEQAALGSHVQAPEWQRPIWGDRQGRERRGAFARYVLAPGWPAALGVSAGAFVAVANDYVTPWITVARPEDQPLPLAVVRTTQSFLVQDPAITRPAIPLALAAFVVIAATMAWCARRAVLRTDR